MALLDGILGHGTETSAEELMQQLQGFLMEGETVHVGYKLIRDFIAFTDRRVLIVDKQGLSGKKTQYISVPYRAVSRFSVETAGTLDIDTDILIWTTGGTEPVRLSCRRDTDIRGIQAALSWGVFGN
jgi:hypothetical protein